MTTCIPKHNCANRLPGTVYSEKVRRGEGDQSIECCALNGVFETSGLVIHSPKTRRKLQVNQSPFTLCKIPVYGI